MAVDFGWVCDSVFAGVMALQTRLVAQCEAMNKKVREDVAGVITMFVISPGPPFFFSGVYY